MEKLRAKNKDSSQLVAKLTCGFGQVPESTFLNLMLYFPLFLKIIHFCVFLCVSLFL